MRKSSKSRRQPTLVEVASRANVSVSTAARVIRNDTYPVKKKLAEAVRAAATEIGYVPNIMARNLRSGGQKFVGLVVGDMLDPYYGEIAEAVTRRANSMHGMSAIVSNMERDPLLELKNLRNLWEQRCAGLILAGGGFNQWASLDQLTKLVDQMTNAGLAVATLSPRGLSVPCFCVDNVKVGRMMAEHLLAHGHQHVGILLGPPESEATQQRLKGASETLIKAGAGFQLIHADYSQNAGARAIQTLMKRDSRITALIAGSAAMAQGVLGWLKEQGKSVPRDVSVIAIGTPRMTSLSSPVLTSIDTHLNKCGQLALDFIAKQVSEAELPIVEIPEPTLFLGGTVDRSP